jgi:hypothetical protein
MTGDENRTDVEFGFREEWEHFSRDNPEFLKRFQNLVKTSEFAFEGQVALPRTVDSAVLVLGRLCLEDFFEILLLCGNGYGFGGQKLVRGLYEKAVTARYLHMNPDLVYDFLDYFWISQYKLSEAIKHTFGPNSIPPDQLRETETKYQSMKGRFQIAKCEECETTRTNHTWSKLDFVSMARACGPLGQLIVPAYYLPMQEAHTTVRSLLNRLQAKSESSLEFNPGPQREIARDALMSAHNIMLNVLDLQKEHFDKSELEEPLQICLKDFVDVWSK